MNGMMIAFFVASSVFSVSLYSEIFAARSVSASSNATACSLSGLWTGRIVRPVPVLFAGVFRT